MIYSLRGRLLMTEPGAVVVECAGVGYRCAVSQTTLSQLPPRGDEAFLYTHMSIREDVVELFGFADEAELLNFRLLTSVNGVGARLALTLLSDFTNTQLAMAVAAGDVKALTRSAGVGNKLAQRIVLELKDKLGGFTGAGEDAAQVSAAMQRQGSGLSEAVSALAALGYSPSDAAAALAHEPQDAPVEELIKRGLKRLARL